MADTRGLRHEHAHGGVWARGPTRGRGDDDAGALPVGDRARPHVVVLTAEGCHLCERALEVVLAVRRELEFELEIVSVDGDPELESRYREQLPVVEIDGDRAFTFFVHAEALRARLAASC